MSCPSDICKVSKDLHHFGETTMIVYGDSFTRVMCDTHNIVNMCGN